MNWIHINDKSRRPKKGKKCLIYGSLGSHTGKSMAIGYPSDSWLKTKRWNVDGCEYDDVTHYIQLSNIERPEDDYEQSPIDD